MKVYCARLSTAKSDIEILDSLIGKDVWIMMEDRTNSSGRSWIRVVSKDRDNLGDLYWVNRKPATAANKYAVHCTAEFKEARLSRKYTWHCDLIRLIHPLEMMTTDELMIVTDSADEDGIL